MRRLLIVSASIFTLPAMFFVGMEIRNQYKLDNTPDSIVSSQPHVSVSQMPVEVEADAAVIERDKILEEMGLYRALSEIALFKI